MSAIGSARRWSRWPIIANNSIADERTEPMGADGGWFQERAAPLDASAPHMCLKMKAYTLLFLRLSVWASLTARLRSDNYLRYWRTYTRKSRTLLTQNYGKQTHLCARIIQAKAKDGGCFLPPRCPLLAIRGWMQRRCRCRDAERRPGQRHEAITALVDALTDWNQRQNSHLFSPGCGSCTWCWSSWCPLSTLDLTRSDGSQTAALLSSRARTDGWRGRVQMTATSPAPQWIQPITARYISQGVLADENRSSSDWFSLKNPEISILQFQLVYWAYKTQTQMLFVLSFISEILKNDALKSSLCWSVYLTVTQFKSITY